MAGKRIVPSVGADRPGGIDSNAIPDTAPPKGRSKIMNEMPQIVKAVSGRVTSAPGASDPDPGDKGGV